MPLSKVEHLFFDGISTGLRVSHFRVADECLHITVSDQDNHATGMCVYFDQIKFHSMNVLSKNPNVFRLPWELQSVGTQFIDDHTWRFDLRCKNIEFIFDSSWPVSLSAVA